MWTLMRLSHQERGPAGASLFGTHETKDHEDHERTEEFDPSSSIPSSRSSCYLWFNFPWRLWCAR
jgi:hypothetical protein